MSSSSSSGAVSSKSNQIKLLGESLYKETVESSDPSIERCKDILISLEKDFTPMTVKMLEITKVGKLLTKSLKGLKRIQRSGDSEWREITTMCESLLQSWKDSSEKEIEEMKRRHKRREEEEEVEKHSDGLPTSVSAYKARLVKQRKEIYKDPPALPPEAIVVYPGRCSLPTRNKKNRTFHFEALPDSDETLSISLFQPNLSPLEILEQGAFGGTYFRPITSAVTNKSYTGKEAVESSLDPQWIQKLKDQNKSIPLYLTSSSYRNSLNKFQVSCGGSLGMWESSGWITNSDPYGWFQWYCRMFQGRRSSDDERQIQRWLKCCGPKGRFLSQLCNKVLKNNKKADDKTISPVIRQTLHHWGIELDDHLLERHQKRIAKK